MMQRTQLSFDSELLRRAKGKAAALGISLAEYVRRLVARDLEGELPERFDLSTVLALGDSGGSDVARHKDAYLDDALEAR